MEEPLVLDTLAEEDIEIFADTAGTDPAVLFSAVYR
jgi:RNA polymerase sigma-70 factor (ECF subfamily)